MSPARRNLAFAWPNILAWVLAAFFVFGGITNILAPGSISDDYRRWGYPDRFHVLTGGLELLAALLLLKQATRMAGATLAALLMTAAALTVLLHGEYAHGAAPLIVLGVVALTAWGTWRP